MVGSASEEVTGKFSGKFTAYIKDGMKRAVFTVESDSSWGLHFIQAGDSVTFPDDKVPQAELVLFDPEQTEQLAGRSNSWKRASLSEAFYHGFSKGSPQRFTDAFLAGERAIVVPASRQP
jgi:hypothetical protein